MATEVTREDHLQWCKTRALEYVKVGDLTQALTSMYSDLGKHPETEGHVGIKLGVMHQMSGLLGTAPEVRKYIQGFN